MGIVYVKHPIFCGRCGKEMIGVVASRKYCKKCAKIVERERERARLRSYKKNKDDKKEFVPPLSHKKYTGPSLDEVMRRANAEDLQYAAYCKKYGLK